MDFELNDQGSVVLLRPNNAEARNWIAENIGQDNGPYYPTSVVEPRYIDAIIDGEDGFTVRDA